MDENPPVASEEVQLLKLEKDAVSSVAANDKGIYFTDAFAPGVFAIDRDGTATRKLAADLGSEALSASGSELFWLNYSNVESGVTQVSGVRDDGTHRRDFVSGISTEIGLQSPNWSVPVDEAWVYWHQLSADQRTTRLLRKPKDNAEENELLVVDSVVGNTWRLGSFLYWSDNEGLARIDVESRQVERLDARAYYVAELVELGEDVYFIGFARDDRAREGLFRVSEATTRLVWPESLATNRSRLVADGNELYVFDNSGDASVTITRWDTTEEQAVPLRTLKEPLSSNVVVDGDRFLFATEEHLLQVAKTPAAGP